VLRRTGVTVDEAEQAAWTVLADGTKVGGARAIALALEVGREARWPTLPWKVPGAPRLLDSVYQFVAANRYRLPGTTPWCVAHPDECTTAPSD
jgi:predicted DCC family thiol-disulfide oxidoreductase YuxK